DTAQYRKERKERRGVVACVITVPRDLLIPEGVPPLPDRENERPRAAVHDLERGPGGDISQQGTLIEDHREEAGQTEGDPQDGHKPHRSVDMARHLWTPRLPQRQTRRPSL